MSTLVDSPVSASYRDGKVRVILASGLELAFPVAGNPRLASGTEAELERIELSPFGLHWPKLDEDLSMRGILGGDFGQRPHRAA
ncbi:MAG: DUF2442 domain-containing protein [Acidobacteria bacterium]|nr:DUF2442 domain-containing protein [Acidobacteriota bacterium]MYA09957.1 DUF2442 domain-containing protein [Gemmatimonadota bacterium]MYJ25481.1 DUF2442 domain-containing protein [Holophagales bacterium]